MSDEAGFWRRRVRLFGLTMEVRFWVMTFIGIALTIIGFLLIIFSGPLMEDLLGVMMGMIGMLFTGFTLFYSASRDQVNTLSYELRDFRREFREFRVEFRDFREGFRGFRGEFSRYTEESTKLLREILSELRRR
ncbi:hypothetical protein B6U99_00880 [Candidatus Geothermarchaeota archaeon ex4572_27]|nr:MAG: hypothetical protein B6U99_00880 [Candidatus Geothermarchaeota archaeon ex4572_27]